MLSSVRRGNNIGVALHSDHINKASQQLQTLEAGIQQRKGGSSSPSNRARDRPPVGKLPQAASEGKSVARGRMGTMLLGAVHTPRGPTVEPSGPTS